MSHPHGDNLYIRLGNSAAAAAAEGGGWLRFLRTFRSTSRFISTRTSANVSIANRDSLSFVCRESDAAYAAAAAAAAS